MADAGAHGVGQCQAMAAVVLLAFLLGVTVGIVIARRSPPSRAEPTAAAAVPTRRARKAGLTEEALTPSDDILQRLRKAADGELDPAEIEAAPPPTAAEEAAAAAAELARREELAEQERRVLERLRRFETPKGDEP